MAAKLGVPSLTTGLGTATDSIDDIDSLATALFDQGLTPLATMEDHSVSDRTAGVLPVEPQQIPQIPAVVAVPELPPLPVAVTSTAGFLDLKGLGRPTSFDGKESSWTEWKFRLNVTASLLGLS